LKDELALGDGDSGTSIQDAHAAVLLDDNLDVGAVSRMVDGIFHKVANGRSQHFRIAADPDGNEAAALVAQLLADIEACASVAELVCLLQGQVAVADGEQWCTTVTADCSVVFGCGHVKMPRAKAGAVDWARVSRVKILHIGAHDG